MSANRVRFGSWSIWRMVLTLVVALIVAASLVFPFGARIYAEQSIPDVASFNKQQITVIPKNAKKVNGLGIRPLPLLSDDALQSVKKGDDQSVTAAGREVFGDQWDSIVSAAQQESAGMFWQDMGDPIFEETRNNVANVMQRISADKVDAAVNLMGLLASFGDIRAANVYDSNNSLPGYGMRNYDYINIVMALAFEAPRAFNSCDVELQSAKIFDLFDGSGSANTLQMYDKAISTCGDDPTPQIAKIQYLMSLSTEGCTRNRDAGYNAMVNNRQWDAIDKQLTAVMSQYPATPAAYTITGDVYTTVADLAAPLGYGSFLIGYLRDSAIAAYENAMKLSTLDTITSSLATAYNNAGEYEKTVKLLAGHKQALDIEKTRQVYAEALAHTGDFSQAATAEKQFIKQYGKNTDAKQGTEISGLGGPHVTRTLNVRSPYLSNNCGAPSTVQDFTYVPQYRSGDLYLSTNEANAVIAAFNPAMDKYGSPLVSLRAIGAYVEYLLLAGEYDDAQQYCVDDEYDASTLCLAVHSGDNIHPTGPFGESTVMLVDTMQNLWRYYGQLDKAKEALKRSDVSAAIINDRLGEILFLQKDYAAAASEFAKASKDTVMYCYSGPSSVTTGPAWAKLRESSALRMAGNASDARAVLDDVEPIMQECSLYTSGSYGTGIDGVSLGEREQQSLEGYIKQEQAQNYYDQQQYNEALSAATEAIPLRNTADEHSTIKVARGALEQLASVSAFAAGDYQSAKEWARKAVGYDPKSPLYQEALADAQRALAENPDSADSSDNQDASSDSQAESESKPKSAADANELMENYREALQSNNSLFSSWNNLGVLQAQRNDVDTAIDSFERAIAANPDYALAWFNLSVAESQRANPISFLRSQGARGKAGSLDAELKNADSEFTFDNKTYSSQIDVSKAIPSDMQLADNLRAAPRALTASLGLLVIGRILSALFGDWITGKVSEELTPKLDTLRKRILMLLRPHGGAAGEDGSVTDNHHGVGLLSRILGGPMLTMTVSFAALVWISGASSIAEYMLAAIFALVLLVLPAIVAEWVGGDKSHADHHRSFWPASLITVVLMLTPWQLGFAPPSPIDATVDGKDVARRKGRWGMMVLGVVSGAMCVVAILTSVPIIRMASATALVVIGSALTPVDPLDGAQIELPGWMDWLITVVMTALTVITAMNIL